MRGIVCDNCGNSHERWSPTCSKCAEELPLRIPNNVNLRPFMEEIFGPGRGFDLPRRVVEEILATLRPIDRQVVVLHQGLDGGRRLVMREIGKTYLGVTGSAVQARHTKTMRRIRHPIRSRKLQAAKKKPHS